MKLILFIMISTLSTTCKAQIMLKGYKCLYLDGQWPNTMAEMYNKNDTFRYTFYQRDIWWTLDEKDDTPENELKTGLSLCFDNYHYFKTKDGLYISTGKFQDNVFYYKVYIPDKTVSLSIRSNRKGATFSDKSKWLLAQIRLNRKKGIFIVNEKKQCCQNPDEPTE